MYGGGNVRKKRCDKVCVLVEHTGWALAESNDTGYRSGEWEMSIVHEVEI